MKKYFPFLIFFLSIQISIGQNLPSAGVTELYDLAINYRADYGSLSRYYFIENSPERRERFEQFCQDYLSRLEVMPFDKLSTGGKVDYLLFKRHLNERLHQLSVEKSEYEAVWQWLNYSDPIYQLEKQRRRGKHLDGQAVAGQLNAVMHALHEKSKAIDKTQPVFPRNLTRRAKGIIKGHQEALKSVFSFYKDYDPQFTWWTSTTFEELDSVLNDYSKLISTCVDTLTLPKDDGSGIIGKPIGKQELIRQLQYQMIPYSPEELVAIANKEFAWCDAELLKASREMGFGDDWKKAQEKVKMAFVEPGHQPEAMLELYNQSVDFLKKHDLLTIPPIAEETWRMRMISPKRQLISPFFLGGEVLQISYPTDEMTHEQKMMSMRGNNPYFSRATVHHELIAGHHLQGFMNDRNHEYRFFYTPFWTEGWALYWELMLWDMDFPRSPEDRIGMLFWRMHRCARIIFSINYHLGEWTPQQCIDFLVDRVGHERANAEGEVRRSFTGNYGPLYQIAYMVGGLQFRAMKEELVDSGKMTYKEFHDAVLRENNMPVEMVRVILTDQSITKDFQSSWRFYD
ncbi:MAG: DUF885 domain-containing protein [Bacteroidetes bacterium]|nr:MAG: DUF885 domain-containing protein [Bacteroidota bacterium]